MIVRFLAASAVLLATGACRATAPRDASTAAITGSSSVPTLLVTNATCFLGTCVPFEMRAFIPQWRVPGQLPEGLPFMGRVTSRVACLRFPVADTLRVIGVDSFGVPRDTALTIWTPDSAVSLTSAFGSTTEFVPASSPGWCLTLSNGSAAVQPVPGPACTP